MTQRHHTRVMRTRRQFAEDDLALLRQEELNTPDTCTRQCLCHLVGHHLRLLQCFVTNLIWLPRFAVVAAFLHVTDRRTEQRRPAVLLGHSEQSKL